MGGPTFSFYYPSFSSFERDALFELTRALDPSSHRVGARPLDSHHGKYAIELSTRVLSHGVRRHREPEGLLQVSVDVPSALMSSLSPSERSVFEAQAGFLPEAELSGFAGPNRALDREALSFYAQKIVERFGGWVVTEHRPVDPPAEIVEVVIKDVATFFGAMANNPEYVAEHLALVPESRYFVIDARKAPPTWCWPRE